MRTTTTTTMTTGLVFRVRTSRINVWIAVRRWGVDEPRWTVFEGINEERIDSELHHVNAISKALGWRSVYRRL